jgi:DNA helicase-2/ATP-dependent DNA helicase PcrA
VAFIAEIYAWFVDGDWRDEPYSEFRPADVGRIVSGLDDVFGGATPAKEVRAYLEDWRAFVLRGHRPVNLVGDLYRLLNCLGVHHTDLSSPAGSARLGALARFSVVLGDFEHVYRRGRQVDRSGVKAFEAAPDRGRAYFRALHNYLLHYARDAYEEFESEASVDLDAVDIVTVHQAKGLEWPVVFMPSLVEGRFPSRRAGEPQEWLLPEAVFPAEIRGRYEGSDAEERRLFYVALTRARDAAYLSCFERRNRAFRPSPSLLEVAGAAPVRLKSLPLPDPPSLEAGAEAPPLDVSYSDLAAFEECGHRYRLSNVLGFQTQIAPELGYGRAIHHVLRQVAERVRASGRVPDDEMLARLEDEEFFVPFASPQAWQRMRTVAGRLVRAYLDGYEEDLHRVWAVERPFQLHLDAGVMHGRADVFLGREGGRDGALAIVDYKVSDEPAREGRYREQLRVYTLAARGEGLQVEAAYLHELRRGARVPVDTDDASVEAARRAVSDRLTALREGHFDAKPKPAKCDACEYRLICDRQ